MKVEQVFPYEKERQRDEGDTWIKNLIHQVSSFKITTKMENFQKWIEHTKYALKKRIFINTKKLFIEVSTVISQRLYKDHWRWRKIGGEEIDEEHTKKFNRNIMAKVIVTSCC